MNSAAHVARVAHIASCSSAQQRRWLRSPVPATSGRSAQSVNNTVQFVSSDRSPGTRIMLVNFRVFVLHVWPRLELPHRFRMNFFVRLPLTWPQHWPSCTCSGRSSYGGVYVYGGGFSERWPKDFSPDVFFFDIILW